MKALSPRRTFTMLMTFLATISGTAYGVYELRGHSDLFADVVKISVLLAIASTCASYVVWTVTHISKQTIFRGGLAGLLTGAAIVPVPYFTAALKTEVFRLHNSENTSLFMSILEAIPFAVIRGLETFQIISKVSLEAVISSVILGIIIAKRFEAPPPIEID